MSLWQIGKSSALLVLLCALGACGEDNDKPDPYLPVGEGRFGGSPPTTGGGGGNNDADMGGADMGEEIDPITQLPQGAVAFSRQAGGGAEVMIARDGDSPFVNATLRDAEGGGVTVAPGDLAINAEGTTLIYTSGQSLWSSALDGSDVKLLLDGQTQGLGMLHHPRWTSDERSIIFTHGAQISRYSLENSVVTALNVSIASCQAWEGLVVQGTSQGYGLRSQCAEPFDAGLFELRFATGTAVGLVTGTALAPQSRVTSLALRDQTLLIGTLGMVDVDGDLTPDGEEGGGLWRLSLNNAVLEGPLALSPPDAFARGVALGRGQVVVDLQIPSNSTTQGLYSLDWEGGTLTALVTGDAISNPVVR